MAMNIFTIEYIVLAITLLVIGYYLIKKPKTSEGSGESSVHDGNEKQLP
jgi:predicted membrane protein